MYVSDHVNNCIRKVMPADGAVSTLCGNGEVSSFFLFCLSVRVVVCVLCLCPCLLLCLCL
jgi:hypothetical protein